MTSKQSYSHFFTHTSSADSITCTNCSLQGHTSKYCPKPITSYGVILFRIRGTSQWNQARALMHGSPTGLDVGKDIPEFLLIQRKDSIGFIEIMRGKYKVSDREYILQNLQGMTAKERESLLHTPFDRLWEELWGPIQDGTHSYRNEREIARQKLEALRGGSPSLEELIARAGPAWDTPEWGFPKGRRDLHETEFACAMREMWEETNIREQDVCVIRGMEPLEESFRGSNDVAYLHKYYMTYVPAGKGEQSYTTIVRENEHAQREIGDIRWCTLEEALQRIRPQNEEKKKVLLRASQLLRQFCPILLGASPKCSSLGMSGGAGGAAAATIPPLSPSLGPLAGGAEEEEQ
jgi:8-oxo-dGTP pyrophosphatase MutT (NUDIX family)